MSTARSVRERWDFEADLEEESRLDLNLAKGMMNSQESRLDLGIQGDVEGLQWRKALKHKVL